MELCSELGEIVWGDVHSSWSMHDGHPPAHELQLYSFDDWVAAVVEHDPTDADAVADVGEWASVA